MNHNKHNLQVGEKVCLDENYANSSHVIIDGFTPMSMYATVHAAGSDPDDPESYWQVMTVRLTPIVQDDDVIEVENDETHRIPLPLGMLYYINIPPNSHHIITDPGKLFHSENYKPIN